MIQVIQITQIIREERVLGDNPTTEEKYSLSGLAWLDENEDGKRASGEKLLNGITAMLVDMENGAQVKETTQTDENGKYEFKNIPKGKYIVLFQYDTNTYKLTEYKKSNISENVNSDVINKTVSLDGKRTQVASTDTIDIRKQYY